LIGSAGRWPATTQAFRKLMASLAMAVTAILLFYPPAVGRIRAIAWLSQRIPAGDG
jgi:D-serine deaminase-like pyridoxal phosphate-dependent protein